jgi:hypothetical protein
MEDREQPAPQEQKRTAAFLRYIYQGGKLIADGRYPEAIKYFRNVEEVNRAGLSFSLSRQILGDVILPENVESDANLIAMNSWFKPKEKIISPSGYFISGKYLQNIPPEQMSQAEKAMAHEIALVHMEEFLHGLQYLRGHPLTEFTDGEIDVAAYMRKNGIPMTPAFLRRYDRGVYLSGDEGADDSLSKRPAIRRGVFVNIQRTSGKVEPDWQISGFDPKTGEVIVRNYAMGLEKQIPKKELADLNSQGVYPFGESKDFKETFLIIDRYKKIQGTQEVYGADRLKNLINSVRAGREDINKIPRSGGLRLKVAELLNIRTASINIEPTVRLS